MRVVVIQCIGTVLKKSRPVSGPVGANLAAFCVLAFLSGFALAQSPATVISSTEQATRDDDRLRVLEAELRKAEDRLEFLAKRRAERLAAGDQLAAQEADEERVRTLSDIAGLKREIGRPASGQVKTTLAVGPSATKTRPAKPEQNPPWWDVYGKVRRTEAASSPSSLPPQNAAAVQSSPTRRME